MSSECKTAFAAGGADPPGAEQADTCHCGAVATPEGESLKACKACRTRAYCSVACQRVAWDAGHKKECKRLKEARKAPLEPAAPSFGSCSCWKVGASSLPDGRTDLWVMDTYEPAGKESNRQVPLSSMTLRGAQAPTVEQVVKVLSDAMVYPEFDTSTAGWRRPQSIKLYAWLLGAEVAAAVAPVLRRLGVPEVEVQAEQDVGFWAHNWYRVQCGLPVVPDADALFVALIEEERWHPMPPNGIARKAAAAAEAQQPPPPDNIVHPTLRPKDVKHLPKEGESSRPWAVVAKDGVVYVFRTDAPNELLAHRRVAIVRGQPAHRDVRQVILEAVRARGRRPTRIFIGQPSIASLTNIEPYEEMEREGLADSMGVMLAQRAMLEQPIAGLIQTWREMGALQDKH